MEIPAKKQKKSYITWSSSERHILVEKRIAKDVWFCGKNANSNEGWKNIAAELRGQLGNEKDAVSCKTQWNSLIKKYKSFFKYRTGEGTGEEAMADDAKDWEFFEKIHAYAAMKDNYHPPFLLDSSDGVLRMQPRSETSSSNVHEIPPNSPSTLHESSSSSPSNSTGTPRARSDFQRLEEHMRKRDKKIGKKILSLLAVFGQMVQTDYPHIDASGLLLSSGSESD